jgi:hypothetical protein
LDFSLIEFLNKKGKYKLKISDAIFLCENVLNPEHQFTIYNEYVEAPKATKSTVLQEIMTCMICMDTKCNFEFMPCCNKLICEACLSQTFSTTIQDIIFKPVNCPFCNENINLNYFRWFLQQRIHDSKEFWRQTKLYRKNIHSNRIYMKNLYNRYLTLIQKIETIQDYDLTDIKPDFKTLLGEEKYFGPCSECTPTFIENDWNLVQNRQWDRVLMCDIPRQCGNGEGGILELQPEMFRCVVCKSRDEDYSDGEFKKCPHCGIKSLKPDGCNFIYCGDHRWCFICNERIENNENGHNKHYWTGPGTSPYSARCRESTDSNSQRYVIRGKCDCSDCREHGGAPLCRSLECTRRAEVKYVADGEPIFHMYCVNC